MRKCRGCALCSRWRNVVAWIMVCVTMGTWMPYIPAEDIEAAEDDESTSVPAPIFETHEPQSWPQQSVPRVDLRKHPKPVHNPATNPSHAQPTPKVPIKIKPVTKPVAHETEAQELVEFLKAQVGKPYVFGGNGPLVYDCSGLTKAAFAHIGWHLPRTSEAQSLVGTRVSLSDLRVGDLLFYGVGPGLAFHVSVYIGNGKYIGAQNPATGVVERYVSSYEPNFARRIL